MKSQSRMIIWAAIAATAFAAMPMDRASVAADAPATDATEPLKQFSKASQALYGKISAGTIRVKVDTNPFASLPDKTRKEFEEWVAKQMPEGPGNPGVGPKSDRPERTDRTERSGRPIRERFQGDNGSGGSTGGPSRWGGREMLFRRFIEDRVKNADSTETAGKWRLLGMKMEMARLSQSGEAIAVVIDNEGHAILLGGAIREGQKDTALKATAPDGSEVNVKVVGALVARGLAVVKLDSASAAASLGTAASRPNPGELLMCISASSGGSTWVVTPQASSKKSEDRFAVLTDDRGPMFLFNTDGELSAVGIDRNALPISTIKSNIQWIINNGKDVVPKQFGVKYDPVMANSPLRTSNSVLGARPAVVVQEIVKDSPAEKSGLKVGDIVVSIDKKPIWMLQQILADISTRTGKVPMGIVRNNVEQTLEVTLEDER